MSAEMLFLCMKCWKQHETATAAACCCPTVRVIWCCSNCKKGFLFSEKTLAENCCTKPALNDKQAKTGIWSANYDSKETD